MLPETKLISAAGQAAAHVHRVAQLHLAIDDRVSAFASIQRGLASAAWLAEGGAAGAVPGQRAASARPKVERASPPAELDVRWAQAVLAGQPGARLVVAYQHPAIFVAEGLGPGDSDLPLNAWRGEAQRLLEIYRRHRRQVFLVDGHAALAHPAAFAEQMRARLGCDMDAGQFSPAASIDSTDAIAQVIADYAIRHDEVVSRLAAELQASSLPLPPPPGSRLSQLVAEWRRLSAATVGKLRELEEENELLLAQLHQVQEELEQHYLTRRNAPADSRLEAEIRQARQQIADIYASKSWRITAPLRKGLDLLTGGAK